MILKPISDRYINSNEFQELIIPVSEQRSDNLKSRYIEGITPSSFPLIISSIFYSSPAQIVVITENSQKMHELYLDLSCFLDENLIFTLTPWETLPYEFISPSERIERERVSALYKIIQGNPMVIIATVESLIRKIPDKSFLLNKGITLKTEQDYPFYEIIELLISYGYSRETKVESFGQFSIKGGIIDIYLSSNDNPVRLDFFGDSLDSIREFDIYTQISHTRHKSITLYPRKELILLNNEQGNLFDILKKAINQRKKLPEDIKRQINNKKIEKIEGIEDLFPLVIKSSNLLSYLNEKSKIILLNLPQCITQKNDIEKTFAEQFAKKTSDTLCLHPDSLIDPAAFDTALDRAIVIQPFTTSQNSLHWKLKSIPNFRGRIKNVREELDKKIKLGWKIIITTGFEGQARRLYDLLSELNPDSDFEQINDESKLDILITPHSEGIEILNIKTYMLSDHEIFGKRYRKKKHFKKKTSSPIYSYLDLKPGDYVVHINHGIGLFKKIERMSAGGVERDFLMIEYAKEDKLYVTLDQITMVQKYIGFEGRKPRIDFLGKKSAWNRIKQKVKQSVEETARELIKIYSKRNALKGFQYPPDTQWQEEFESLFEFEETPDQITAIEDVKDDMERPRPMDMLICGDVGFGKTEVAIRAAFKAVMAGKQCAMLVPTTVLAMQHHSTFCKRFYDYPIEIEMVSRFKTPTEIKKIKMRLAKGEIDIIIGTHALLAKDINIKSLGLLIIDEEQRFGVRHKEKLKKFRTLVDVLTLSATPIPRTIHMAMTGIRDLTVILSPPENRKSIDTFVLEDNPDILRTAVLKEIKRGGQVFYVHNRVKTIDAQAEILKKLVPEAYVCIAHGQMNKHLLEDVMIDFLNGKYDVLISTSIIESGLDMPNVNTIIINRADTFGLSQLYQLKGRVGRSVRKAYAYLFYPGYSRLSDEARKRLEVISEYTDLGSGLKIAIKDLEIRGSGNILGKEQSGNIIEVGFELYTKMLDNAVKTLKGEKPEFFFRTPIFLRTDFYIPDNYIPDQKQKIEFYKRFESCDSIDDINILDKELTDRFGPRPKEVNILVELEKIRTLASSLIIDEIFEDSNSIRIKITDQSKIDTIKAVAEISRNNSLSIAPEDKDILILKPVLKDDEKKLAGLKKLLQQLS